MSTHRPEVVLVGALPPPVHGLSTINAQMLNLLRRQAQVHAFNPAPGEAASTLQHRIARLARLPFLLVRFAWTLRLHRPSAVYLGLSGGIAQVSELLFIALTRCFGVPLFVHHHSFGYLDRRRWHASLVMPSTRKATHIVLCERMKHLLCTGYSVAAENVVVLSNVAFLGQPERPQGRTERRARPIQVGFLSNITEEKGIFTFFASVELARAAGLDVEAVIAGPVDPSIRERFDECLRRTPCARHLGPIYGDAKQNFFQELDVLLFPTAYVHEAQPLTVLEALSFGVPVVANALGCIREMLTPESGVLVDTPDAFPQRALEELRNLRASAAYLHEKSASARAHHQQQQLFAGATLDALAKRILGGPVAGITQGG